MQANSVGWTPSTSDPNAGLGEYGSCCSEMDIWEANKMAAAYTPSVLTSIWYSAITNIFPVTHVPSRDKPDAQAQTVVSAPATPRSAMLMDVISTPTAWATPPSTVLVSQSTPARSSPSSPNSSPTPEPPLAPCPRSSASTCKTETSSPTRNPPTLPLPETPLLTLSALLRRPRLETPTSLLSREVLLRWVLQ